MKMSSGLRGGLAVTLLLISGFLVACGAETQGGGPAKAHVEEVEVQLLESFPVQVRVVIRGELPDACTEIEEVTQRFEAEEDMFSIEIKAVRTTDDPCAEVLVPFEETVALDAHGLQAGTYTVNVNGTKETFTLDVDNAAADAELPNPASVYCEEQGYRVEIRTDDQGGQYGVCVFPDGSECDEWAYYRGECGPEE